MSIFYYQLCELTSCLDLNRVLDHHCMAGHGADQEGDPSAKGRSP